MGLLLNVAKRWADGESAMSIARGLGWSPGTIYNEEKVLEALAQLSAAMQQGFIKHKSSSNNCYCLPSSFSSAARRRQTQKT